jgi:hypothetical protein
VKFVYRRWLNKLINFSKGHNISKTIIMKINCSKFILVLGLIIFCTKDVLLKVYDKCDLAQELLSKDEIVFNDVNTCKWFNLDNNFIIYFNWQTIMKQFWNNYVSKLGLCIIEGESSYNTTAYHTGNWDGSDDHGLFQVFLSSSIFEWIIKFIYRSMIDIGVTLKMESQPLMYVHFLVTVSLTLSEFFSHFIQIFNSKTINMRQIIWKNGFMF